jgi:hypothetical protein
MVSQMVSAVYRSPMLTGVSPAFSARPKAWRLAVQCTVGFWILHLSHRASIAAVSGTWRELVDPGLDVALAFGFLLSLAFAAILVVAGRRSLPSGLLIVGALSLPFSLIYASSELALWYLLSPVVNGAGSSRTTADGTTVTSSASGEVSYRRRGEQQVTIVKLSPLKQRVLADAPRTITGNATGWYFFYFGLGSFFVGMSSAARLREAERAAGEFQRLAQASQLRALRYQINPHFLFNTLNSLSTLVMTARTAEAETMILNLSTFFRTTLAIDPEDDVELRDEIRLQRLYLDIESARFPSRMDVRVDVPPHLMSVLVPALLLQPLVENAIKYGVARNAHMVGILIEASQLPDEMLEIVVQNHSEDPQRCDRSPKGTGVGIANVQQRLAARFGPRASCTSSWGMGMFRVVLTLPIVRS